MFLCIFNRDSNGKILTEGKSTISMWLKVRKASYNSGSSFFATKCVEEIINGCH